MRMKMGSIVLEIWLFDIEKILEIFLKEFVPILVATK